MTKPFEGIRILDFSQVISGPYGTELLALQGADVIKFERPPFGDESRTFCLNPDLIARGTGSAYLSLNAGKRSMALDLKFPEAREIVLRMAADADVLVENFRPGVMARLGLDYKAIAEVRPDIIYCSISGYGQDGPEANAPAYDGAVQAASGIMSITGFPENGATRVGFPFSDAATGSAAAFAIASALYRRLATGKGQYIDLAMLDASLSMMSPVVGFWLIGGGLPYQIGNLAWSRRPTSDMFRTRDDFLMLVVNSEAHFRVFCREIGLGALHEEPMFADWPARQKNSAELRTRIENALQRHGAATWEGILRTAGIAASRVASISDVIEGAQIRHRELVLSLDGAVGFEEPLRVLNAPFRSPEDGPGTTVPPPACGQHTEEILKDIGVSDEEIEGLRESKCIWTQEVPA